MDRNPDLILLHPPSVYDFRNRNDLIFPQIFTSLVKVSPMLEMFPLGFYNIKSFLESRNIKIKIYNLANMMLKDWNFNVKDFLFTIKPKIFGVDLHWLAQTQGALEVSKIIKEVHKDVPILLGGISASYFYDELMKYPFIDFIIRGNITFSPLELLIKRIIANNTDYSGIPNLCYKEKGEVIINPNRPYSKNNFYPIDWNIKELKHKNINFVIFNPQTGCRHNCCFCGASHYANRRYALQTNTLLYRPRSQILKELDSLRSLKNRISGQRKMELYIPGYWYEDNRLRQAVLVKLKRLNLFSSVHLETFYLMPKRIVKEITKHINTTLEISPNSHDLKIRKFCHRAVYTNSELELWINEVLKLNVKSVAVYFMIGLSGQTLSSVLDTAKYCEHLLAKFRDKKKVIPYISTMIPFLNPGAPAFEKPQRYGYKIFYRTVQEHYMALTEISLKKRMNYETRWMSRGQIIEATYKSAKILALAKMRYGYLPPNFAKIIISRLENTFRLINILNKVDSIKDSRKRLKALNRISGEVSLYNREIMQGKFCDMDPLNLQFYNYKISFWYEI